MMPGYDIYGYTISIDTHVKSREEMIRELEDEIVELEIELNYKRQQLITLLNSLQWDAR
jgi:uncharacterized coiled-coil protein SlyX